MFVCVCGQLKYYAYAVCQTEMKHVRYASLLCACIGTCVCVCACVLGYACVCVPVACAIFFAVFTFLAYLCSSSSNNVSTSTTADCIAVVAAAAVAGVAAVVVAAAGMACCCPADRKGIAMQTEC